MNKIFWFLGPIALSSVALAALDIDVIYGPDGRKDVYQVTNTMHKKLAASTAGMIAAGILDVRSIPGHGKFVPEALGTLKEFMNVCSTEAFADQFLAPSCSGFLIGPDTLVTAGHCYNAKVTPEQACQRNYWVFGYEMTSAKSNPTQKIPFANIYTCKEVIGSRWDKYNDFAVIKLDRPVIGRAPLRFRTSGKASNSAELVVIGHPSALPTKVASGGKIIDNSNPVIMVTSLDTFQGNSGSAVFDARSGLVEGILIQGKTDYVPSNPQDDQSCQVVNKCDANGKNCIFQSENEPTGENVYRITNISESLVKYLRP